MRKENADTRQCNNRNDELKHGTILKQSVSLLIETLDAVLFQDDFVRAEFGFVQPIFEPERRFVADCNSRDTLNSRDMASSLRRLKTRNLTPTSLMVFGSLAARHGLHGQSEHTALATDMAAPTCFVRSGFGGMTCPESPPLQLLCHVYNRMRDADSHSYGPMCISRTKETEP